MQTANNLFADVKNPYLEASEWGWQIDPIGLRTVCNQLYGLPKASIYIYVDRDSNGKGSNKRYKKTNFSWYQNVIATNGEQL
ncbi:hypothetical protein [Shouchella clausii]|uniref:hypothetical protein n=1 Tax=Shouchella clausii TaxID=79880 RepID=UPI003C740C6C